MRSTRQTELEDEYNSKVSCAWIGNSEEAAHMHDLQVTEEHFARAVGKEPGGVVQKWAQQPPEMTGNGEHTETPRTAKFDEE